MVNQPNCLLLNYDGAKPKKVEEAKKDDRNGTSALDETKTNRKQSLKKKDAKEQSIATKQVEVRASKSLKNSSKLSNEREKGSPSKGQSNMNVDEEGEEEEKKVKEEKDLNLPALGDLRNQLDRCKKRF